MKAQAWQPPSASGSRPTWLSLLVVITLAVAGQQLLGHWQDRRLGEPLRQLAAEGDIRLISSATCVYCTRAREWLDAQQVRYSECFIESDAQCQADYQRQGALGTPTLLVRGQPQLGFDPQRVARALAR
jgi:glutaredoxin